MSEYDRTAIAGRWLERIRRRKDPCQEVETDLQSCIDEIDRLNGYIRTLEALQRHQKHEVTP